MALFLVQHGKKEADPQPDLSPTGIAEVTQIAKMAKQYGIQPRCIKHSGKPRAQQTAEIFATELRPLEGVQERCTGNEGYQSTRRSDSHSQ